MVIKRLFIGNIPESVVENDLKTEFGNYGTVESVEIKTKKTNFGLIAFMNIDIEDHSLKQCIKEFQEQEFYGVYLNVNVAKETFLDKLKREREEAAALLKNPNTQNKVQKNTETYEPIRTPIPKLPTPNEKNSVGKSSSSSSDSSDDEEVVAKQPQIKKTSVAQGNGESDFLIKKSSFHSMTSTGKIKIESFGGSKQIQQTNKNEKYLDERAREADEKRKESLNKMKEVYNQQQQAIKNALARVDTKSHTNFTENYNETQTNNNKRNNGKPNLFDGDDENMDVDDYNNDFRIREQYQGTDGQKLMELQSRFKHDKRFEMDKKFVENNNYNNNDDDEYNDEEENHEDNERDWQIGILEGVVGKKFQNNDQVTQKTMLRYDPTRKEHSKYVENNMQQHNNNNKMRSKMDVEEFDVSKETYFQVTGDFSQTLNTKQNFSLLNAFGSNSTGGGPGRNDNKVYKETNLTDKVKDPRKQNPFKYDSSDTENEDEITTIRKPTNDLNKKSKRNTIVEVFRETLFFLINDARLKDGCELFRKVNDDGEHNPGKLKPIFKRKIWKNEQRLPKEKRSKRKAIRRKDNKK